jgi:hypothetical protein
MFAPVVAGPTKFGTLAVVASAQSRAKSLRA